MMKLFTFTAFALAGMSSVNAAIHGTDGILPEDMKELLQDKYAAVDGGVCMAIRDQRCEVDNVRFACKKFQYIHSTCSGVHESRTANKNFGRYCVNSELLNYDEVELMEKTETHDCAVLSAGDGCVDDTATAGLKCKEGLTCVGYSNSTVAGTPDALGNCTGTAINRNSEPAVSTPAPSPASSSPPATEAPSSGTVASLLTLHICVAVGVLHYFML